MKMRWTDSSAFFYRAALLLSKAFNFFKKMVRKTKEAANMTALTAAKVTTHAINPSGLDVTSPKK